MLKWIEVDLGAVAENCRAARKLLHPGVEFQAVVKADGYGHGAAPVARTAEAQSVDSLGVLTVEEAAALRDGGVKAPVHLLAPPLPDEAAQVAALGLTPTVDSGALLSALDRAAAKPIAVTVDLDFGLGRWGIAKRDLNRFLKDLAGKSRLRLAGVSTHLDYVPGKNQIEAEEKLKEFAAAARAVKRAHPNAKAHAANSSILLDFPHWQLDGVRVGNLLYGINRTTKTLALQNPWRFFARVISVKKVTKGQALGYGSEYFAPRPMTVAAVPAGYADGLTMEPAERLIGLGKAYKFWGILKGREVPFIGRCGIAHVLLDVSSVPTVAVGDPVLLPVRRTAASARIPRVYKR